MKKNNVIRILRILFLFVIFTSLSIIFDDATYIIVLFAGMITGLIDCIIDPLHNYYNKKINDRDIAETANLIIDVFEDTLNELNITEGADDLGYMVFKNAEQTKDYNIYKKQNLKDEIISKINNLLLEEGGK